MTTDKTPEGAPSGVARRTLAVGAAWAVPAIGIASAAPAYAASGPPPTVKGGRVIKWPGASCEGTPDVPTFADNNKAYLFPFQIHNVDPTQVIYIYSVVITTTSGITFTSVNSGGSSTPILPNATVTYNVWANSSNSGNLSFNATATVTWGHNWPAPDPHVPPHPVITESWCVPATPTPSSLGLGQCAIPPYAATPKYPAC